MITPTRLSYAVLAFTIVLVGVLNLGVPLLVVLFSYFALRQLYYLTKRKWLALILFAVGVAGVGAGGAGFYSPSGLLRAGAGCKSNSPGKRPGSEGPVEITISHL